MSGSQGALVSYMPNVIEQVAGAGSTAFTSAGDSAVTSQKPSAAVACVRRDRQLRKSVTRSVGKTRT